MSPAAPTIAFAAAAAMLKGFTNRTGAMRLLTALSGLLALLAGSASPCYGASPAEWCTLAPGKPDAAWLRKLDTQLVLPPAPLPRLHTEGTLPHQGIYDASVAAKRDLPRMRQFALAWRQTADGRYLDAASSYLDAWSRTYQPSLNPIDETDLDALIDTYAITRHALNDKLQNQLTRFIRDWGAAYIADIKSARKPLKTTYINNWNSHRIKLLTLSAVALNDKAMFAEARRLYRQQLDNNIDATGITQDFQERDALHYVTYDLEPLARAAIAARAMGEDWLPLTGARGGSLDKALRWLQPFAEGRVTHMEFVNSSVRFDTVRREAGLPGFSGEWQPANARNLYSLAAVLSANWRELALRLGNPPDWVRLCWAH